MLWTIIIKRYVRCKTIFCQKVALDMYFTDSKICHVIIGIATWRKLHLCLFLLNPLYYQIEIWSNTSALYEIFGFMLETGN